MRIIGRKIVFIFLIITCVNSFSQHVFNGYVIDSNTGLGIESASVSIYSTKESTTTDSTGSFTLSTRKKKPEVIVVHVGYKTDQFKLTQNQNFSLPLYINESVIGQLDIHPDNILHTIERNPCQSVEEKERLRDSILQNRDLVSVNAWYPGGDICFLNEVINSLYSYVVTGVIKPFGVLKVSFVVDISGRPSEVLVDKEIPKEFLLILNDFFLNSRTWKPAVQFNKFVPTQFVFYLYYANDQNGA